MRIPLIPVLLSIVSLPFSCQTRPGPIEIPHELLELSSGPVGPNYSLTEAGEDLHLVMPEYETLSLKMNVLKPNPAGGAPLIDETLFLDRINHSQEVDSLFGSHFYSLLGNGQDVLYLDQEKEDRRILKRINRSGPGSPWNVDTLPLAGRLVSGWRDERGRLRVFLQHQDALYTAGDPHLDRFESLMEPFAAEGDITRLDGTGAAGFTVYDGRSGRLFHVMDSAGGPVLRPLLTGGKIHHAAQGADGMLKVLTYEPRKSELILYRESQPDRFRSLAVTPCRGTTSVHLFFGPDGDRFLYNERIVTEEGGKVYQISLLYPVKEEYRKAVVYSSDEPIQMFRALVRGERLTVILEQDRLRLISADLGRIPVSSGS